MSKVKIQGNASGTGVLTVTAPNTSTDRTITLPDSTGSLIADDGSGNIDVTGVGKFSLDNNGGAGGGIVASNTNASNPALGGYVDLMERGTAFGTANNYGMRLYYDGNANKFHIQGGNETTVATHLTMVRDSGEITIDTGDLIFGTAGKGIVLGSTSNTDANTLDDYEEGTFTPNMDIEGASGSVTLSASYGYYVKIGSFVSARLDMQVSAISGASGSNAWEWSGLPFAVHSSSGYVPISGLRVTGMASQPNALTGFVVAGSSGGRLEEQTANTVNSSNLLSSTTRVQMTFIYQV